MSSIPEYLTVRSDDKLNDVWLELCKAAPDAILIGVNGQSPALKTIQHLKAWRYDLLYILIDGGCTWYSGILLNENPIRWGVAGDLAVLRYPNSGNVVPHQFRENRRGNKNYRHTVSKRNQNQRLAARGFGPILGRLSEFHSLDFVPWVCAGPANKMPKKWISR